MKRGLIIGIIALITILGQSLQSQSGSAFIDPELISAMQKETGPFEVVVTFKGDGPLTTSQIEFLKEIGIKVGLYFQSLPIAGVLATADQVNLLAQNPDVLSVFLNKELVFYNNGARAITGVDRLRTDSNIISRNNGFPISGKGVGVLVNDSGIDATHPDLKFGTKVVQNVMAQTNLRALSSLGPVIYVENVPNTDNNSGHGTHVAGTVAGTGAVSQGKYEGVAPGAHLIGYGSGGALLILDGIGGFDYAITHQFTYNIRVVTNSWGSSGSFNPVHPINIASKKAYDRGIVVTFAAGNSGPAPGTMNPYSLAPWVISVAAGNKQGGLADFSSRGIEGGGGSFTLDGQTWFWENRPTVVAPGVNIVSCMAVSPLGLLGVTTDYAPYYTVMSGTSMATPHVAGIVALMLEANPSLLPSQVKQILQSTATNMPGRKPFEVGAGYVNAYSAVLQALSLKYGINMNGFGKSLNLNRNFNSSVNIQKTTQNFTIPFNPATTSSNRYNFNVPPGITELLVQINARGLFGATGNPINLVLIDPDGKEYSSGITLLFAINYARAVSVTSPKPGTWTVELRGLRGTTANPIGVAFPENISGTITFTSISGFSGLSDISGHPYENAIKLAVSRRLIDGYPDGTFKPNQYLTRMELAEYLMMGRGIRQYLPIFSGPSFSDVPSDKLLFAESVTARGASLYDTLQIFRGVMLPTGDGTFSPNNYVTRLDLVYSLVQSLGLQKQAEELSQKLGSAQPVYYQEFTGSLVIGTAGLVVSRGNDYVDINFTSKGSAFKIDATLTPTSGLAVDLDFELRDSQGRVIASSATASATERIIASIQGGKQYTFRVIGWINGPTNFKITSTQFVTDPNDANNVDGETIIVMHPQGARIPIVDLPLVPPELRGYVKLAYDLGIIKDYGLVLEQGTNLLKAFFNPFNPVTRGYYALSVTGTYAQQTTFKLTQTQDISNNNSIEPLPLKFKLEQNYPNPFNPATTIEFEIPEPGKVKLEVFNSIGQRVETLVDEFKPAGKYRVTFNAGNLPSGVYFYRLESGKNSAVRKMILVK